MHKKQAWNRHESFFPLDMKELPKVTTGIGQDTVNAHTAVPSFQTLCDLLLRQMHSPKKSDLIALGNRLVNKRRQNQAIMQRDIQKFKAVLKPFSVIGRSN